MILVALRLAKVKDKCIINSDNWSYEFVLALAMKATFDDGIYDIGNETQCSIKLCVAQIC